MRKEVEIWKYIPGFRGLYQVSSLGRIRSMRPSARLKNPDGIRSLTVNRGGYYRICLSRGSVRVNNSVHVFVAKSFLGPKPRGHEVGHRDGNKLNCRASNLMWVTPKQNYEHKRLHGTHRFGEQVKGSKLNDAKVHVIFWLYAIGFPQDTIGQILRIHQINVSRILRRKMWAHVPVSPEAIRLCNAMRKKKQPAHLTK